ncbi:MAG: MoaD/ThiS family protein, partial [Anaerolineae bacterium]
DVDSPGESVRVEIRYLSATRDRTGRKNDNVGFRQGATLQDVARWLDRQYGISVPGSQVMATLNGRGWKQSPSGLNTQVRDGDVIALFPPIAGG